MPTSEMNVLTHITGTFLIQAEGAFLNGAGLDSGEDRNAVIPKTHTDINDRGQRTRVPYVSAQAWRRWLRLTFQEENPTEPGTELRALSFNAKGNPDKIGTEMNPINFAEDDIFGYMRAEKGQGRVKEEAAGEESTEENPEEETDAPAEKGKKAKTERTKAVMRPSPFVSSILRSLRKDGWQGDDEGFVHLKTGSPLPYKTKFYNTQLQGVFGLNYVRLGVFRNDGDRIELDENLVKQYLGDGSLRGQNGSTNIYEVTENKRRERATMILRALSVLRGGAKQAQFGTDVAPKAIIIAGLNCGNLIFNDLFEEKNGEPIIKLAALKQTLEDYRQRIVTPVFIGVRDGYLQAGNEAELKAWVQAGGQLSDGGTANVRLASPVKAIESLTSQLAEVN